MYKHRAKMVWDDVCDPIEEGGPMTSKEWNKTAITKHLWNLAQPKSNPIWVN